MRGWIASIEALLVACALLAGTATALGVEATAGTVAPLFERTRQVAQTLATSVAGQDDSSITTHTAFRTYEREMAEIRQELAGLEWAPEDQQYRDALLRSYDLIGDDALAVAAGRMSTAEFASAVGQQSAYLQGQIDQISAQPQGKRGDGGPIGGWPFPLNQWWFWILVVFGPVVPITLFLIYGAGTGIAGVWNWLRGRHQRA